MSAFVMRGRRDEQGAAAVLYALLITAVLIPVAALSTDLGNAMSRKTQTQTQADFAARDAGQFLTGTPDATWVGTPVPANIVNTVVSSMNANQPQHDGHECWRDTTTDCVTAAQLVNDNDLTNGDLRYTAKGLRVISPEAHVQFGLASAFTSGSTDVASTAIVSAGTPGSLKTFPSFATDGCDWGPRTIFAPAASNAAPSFTPNLKFPNDKNSVVFDLASENPSPDSVPVNPSTTTVTLKGTGMDTVQQIGFFQDGAGDYKTIPQASFDSQTASQITISLPDDLPDLTTSAGLWWVRVFAPRPNGNVEWSEIKTGQVLNTVPFEVGESYLRCAGVASGSYGDIIVPRKDVNSADWTALNIAAGFQMSEPNDVLTLNTYPGSPTSIYGASSAPNLCVTSDSRTIYSTVTGSPVLKRNTNCVDNGTGLTANDATRGLVSGVGTHEGRLTEDSADSCDARRTVTVNTSGGPTGFEIDDSVLSCFLTTGVDIQTIYAKSYSGGPALSCDIFESPRFFYQPVLQVRPSGGANHYSIVDFRPAFITHQDPSAMKGDGPASTENGVTIVNNDVVQLDVVFFHPNALSTGCSNAFGPVLGGTTKKEIRLVD